MPISMLKDGTTCMPSSAIFGSNDCSEAITEAHPTYSRQRIFQAASSGASNCEEKESHKGLSHYDCVKL